VSKIVAEDGSRNDPVDDTLASSIPSEEESNRTTLNATERFKLFQRKAEGNDSY
jgi:hypothetical protein